MEDHVEFFPFSKNFQPTASSSGLMPLVPGPGTEFANFGDRDLMLGLTSEEAWVNLTDEDLQVKGRRTCKWVDFTYSTGEESWWFVCALLFVLFVRFDEGKSGRSGKPIHSFETELHGYWMKMGEGFFGDSNVTMFITGK